MAASGEPKVAKRRYMLADGGFFETEEPKHDWSGLKFVDWQDGECYLVDRNTERTLMVFRSDGEVLCVPGAYGGAGHFDEKGRLIVK
ncbi:MAG: hypothetical protein PF495_01680 [Spirochaetales bacterium]|jgi:hypothetical protein|nr:hypothetical protein [Spirochaetales bacterium]